MFFRSEDEQQLQRALAADKRDRKELARLERELSTLRPEWDRLQSKPKG